MKIEKTDDYEIVEIKPIILGGEPENSNNKMKVNRSSHIEYVRYWNKVIKNSNIATESID